MMPLQVYDNCAIAPPFALRPVIDADDTGRWPIWQCHTLEQAQNGIGTCWHGQTRQQAGTGFSA